MSLCIFSRTLLPRVSDVRVSFETLPSSRTENCQRVATRRTELRTPKLGLYHLTRTLPGDSSQRFIRQHQTHFTGQPLP